MTLSRRKRLHTRQIPLPIFSHSSAWLRSDAWFWPKSTRERVPSLERRPAGEHHPVLTGAICECRLRIMAVRGPVPVQEGVTTVQITLVRCALMEGVFAMHSGAQRMGKAPLVG